MNIICLDIDDSIFPNNNTWIGEINDNFDILEINLKRIKKIIEIYNCKIFITSSWYSILKLNNNKIEYNGYYTEKNKSNPDYYYHTEIKAYELISNYLNGYIVGLSSGNREIDIRDLVSEGNLVISIDDEDLSYINDNKHLHCNIHGLITNKDLCDIYHFFKKHEKNH